MTELRKPPVAEKGEVPVFGPGAAPLIDSNQAAQFLGVHPRTLQRMVLRGRARYQFGSLTRKKRAKGSDAWEFRYYDRPRRAHGARKLLHRRHSVDKYKTKALAQKAVEALLLKLNSETPQQPWRW
jgi:hypothetical protein